MTADAGSMQRTLVIVMAALAAALTPGAGASAKAAQLLDTLRLQATFTAAWEFGALCPPGTPAGVECVRFVATADVPGLGQVTSTYVKTLFEPNGCDSVTQFRHAVLDVAGKGTIELSLPGTVCGLPAPAEAGPFALTITGGTGIYAGAAGSIQFRSSVHEPRGRCGVNLCGSATDTWAGSLTVPGLDFDLTPPALAGAVAKAVRAPKRMKRVPVSYAIRAEDAVDGAVPVACKPRSGSRFKRGRTTVTCSATDSSANTMRARFAVIVR